MKIVNEEKMVLSSKDTSPELEREANENGFGLESYAQMQEIQQNQNPENIESTAVNNDGYGVESYDQMMEIKKNNQNPENIQSQSAGPEIEEEAKNNGYGADSHIQLMEVQNETFRSTRPANADQKPIPVLEQFLSLANLLKPEDFNNASAPDLKINRSHELGKGGQATVYQGSYRGENVAVKIPNFRVSENDSLEMKILATIGSEVLPKLKAFYVENDKPCLVMEAFMEGNLQQWLSSKPAMNESVLYRLAADIAEGVIFLHDSHILYRDFKSLNVLLYYSNTPNGEELRAQICDFGLCASIEDSKSGVITTDMVGTIPWNAPELFQDETQCSYSKASDVFGLGMVLYEIVSGNYPYHTLIQQSGNMSKIKDHIKNNQRPWDLTGWPKSCPQVLRDLILRCCDPNPGNRPSAVEVHTILKEELHKLSPKKNQNSATVSVQDKPKLDQKEVEVSKNSLAFFENPAIKMLRDRRYGKALERENKFENDINILNNKNFKNFSLRELKQASRQLTVIDKKLEDKIKKYRQNPGKYPQLKYEAVIKNYTHLRARIETLQKSLQKVYSSRKSKPHFFQVPKGSAQAPTANKVTLNL